MQKVHRPFFALGLLAAFLTGCQITEDTIVAHDAIDGALVDDALAALVEDNSLVGASALIYRNDQEIYRATVGMADREANQVWRRDTLVTLFSMTIPITGVTLMSPRHTRAATASDPGARHFSSHSLFRIWMRRSPCRTIHECS